MLPPFIRSRDLPDNLVKAFTFFNTHFTMKCLIIPLVSLKGCSKWVALHNHYLKESSHCSCHQRDHDFTLLEFRAVGISGGGGQGGPYPGYPKPHTVYCRDVTAGATEVAPKFSDTLTLSPPGRADSAYHRRGRI